MLSRSPVVSPAGTDTLILSAASTLTVANVETITGSGGNDLVTGSFVAGNAVDLAGGTDTLVLNAASTLTVANVETITGSGGNDLVTGSFVAGSAVDLAGGTD